MRTVDQVPGLVPDYDVSVYIVLDHFGRRGSACETDEEQADLENIINNMLHGEYNDSNPVFAFYTAEKSSDVSEDVAWEVLKRVASQGLALPASTRSFCEFHVGLRETALAENARIYPHLLPRPRAP
jgi:hypothetical protein